MAAATLYHFQGFTLDTGKKCLLDSDGRTVVLSQRALDTLIVLVENRGAILSKDELMARVWHGMHVEENNLNQAVTSLRKALGDSKKKGRFIKTFTGKGYCFVADVTRQAVDDEPVSPALAAAPELGQARAWIDPRHPAVMVPSWQASRAGFALTLLLFVAVIGASWLFDGVNRTAPATGDAGNALAGADQVREVIPDSIAVLPFTTLNPDDDNKVYAMGLHLELINMLAKLDRLNLVSQDGVQSPVLQERPLTELGRLLNVEYIISGTVMLLDDTARINLYLLDADTGVIAWTDNYKLPSAGFSMSIPAKLTLDVAGAMGIDVDESDRLAILERPTESFEAYRYFLAASSAYNAMEFEKTWDLSKKALELDPAYLDALDLFAKVNSVLTAAPLAGMTSDNHITLALESANTMIQQAPDNPVGYITKAVALGSKRQWHDAMAEVNKLRAMEAPLYRLQFLTPILMSLGQFDDAIDILKANLEEEPINLYARGFLLAAHEMAGNRMQARMEYDLGEELNQEWWGDTVNIFLAMGRNEHIDGIQGLAVSSRIKSLLYKLNRGELDAVKTEVAGFMPEAGSPSNELIYYSAIAAYTGNQDKAIELMTLAERDVGMNIHWIWLPVFEKTRQQPGFKALLEDSGLLAYWQEFGWPEICRPAEDSLTCNAGADDLLTLQ